VTRTLALILLAALSGVAIAAPPAGWKPDEALALDLTRKAQRGSHFGGTETTKIAVEAHLAPGGGSLFVTRAEAMPPADIRDGVATRALFVLVQSAYRYGPAQIEINAQTATPAAKTLEATLTWRDPGAGIRQVGRTVVAADVRHLVSITGECMLPDAAPKEVEAACLASLASLDLGIALDQRVALVMIGAPGEAQNTPPAPTQTAETPEHPRTHQPSMGDGARTPMTPMTISQAKREIDRRPLYLGGGIVVLAALFWWNRRRRDLFDREDGVTTAKPEPETTSGDDDADDLQAAARGNAPKDES